MRFFDSRLILFFVALYSTAGFGQISLPLDSTGLNTDRFVEDLIQSYIESRSEDGDFDYNTFMDRLESIKKHRGEKFLLPCSDILKPSIPDTLNKEKRP